ncbi:UDP-sugar pyrophosphorylase [Morella rubra]|uniref:UDP-sugar pyrophosphorylase n=1 Tax=Morella rubra TaxID=262757 RepID=A0A6A1URN2_9ROSI|nr:UDP-sugar pyrophosphorylase [Morella rubra]
MASTALESTTEGLSKLAIHADFASYAPNLQKNLHLLSPEQTELANVLLEMGQSHLFEHWAEPAVDDEEKKRFFEQMARLNSSYPGGLASYIKTARELLADSKAGKNPFDGFTPSVPKGEVLTFGDENFINFEEAGIREARKAAFVLVAGGLGERLSGIQWHKDKTFHGHGDVHGLLFSSGLLREWQDAGLRWVLFFQDTNGLLFKAIPPALGVSATRQYHVNSLAVPRKAKEAIGGIAKLTHADGRTMVINVEYNQLDPLLRATGHEDGDVNDETGYSPFPGNINQLILELGPYLEELTKTRGAIKEFVNPKYKDASKSSFKSSTRLECMMQDYPKTLPPSARVGFTVMDTWLAYAPVKNNPEDAAKVPKGNPCHSATSGEMAIYRANSLILRKAGVQVADPVLEVFNGQEVEVWPRITWKPKWGLAFSEIKRKVSGSCTISQRSTMVIKGRNVFLEDLSLDGALLINAIEDAEVKARGSVQNKGWVLEKIDYKDASEPEELRIRGFRINKIEQLEKNSTEPGKFC